MRMSWRVPLVCLLLCCGISIFWGVGLSLNPKGFSDIKAVYYGSRCLLEGRNPYKVSELTAVYDAEREPGPKESAQYLQAVTLCVNLPATLLLVAPLALVPFGVVTAIWLAVSTVLLMAAAWLMWRLGARYAPAMSLALICMVLANNEIGYAVGNTALLVVGPCVLAAWCFTEDRFALVGVVGLGLSLAVKPHDAGFLWLYFLLAGGIYRRRALESLLVAAVPAIAGAAWVWRVAPHWMQDWQANMRAISGVGGINHPGPFSITGSNGGMVIDLQSAISVLWNTPKIYDLVTYVICGAFLLIWILRTVKLRGSRAHVWLGVAAVMAPTFLITYHRGQDAKLLMLAVPACAMLWSKRGAIGWLALVLTTLAVVFTADLPLTAWVMLRPYLPTSMGGMAGKVLAMIFLEPTPLVLLAMGAFYLWVYVRYDAVGDAVAERRETQRAPLDGRLELGRLQNAAGD